MHVGNPLLMIGFKGVRSKPKLLQEHMDHAFMFAIDFKSMSFLTI